MKLTRTQLQIKTQISQQSNIDVFCKLEVSFLEKFFNYNLNDYFSDYFCNIYDEILHRKVMNKNQKNVSSNIFIIKKSFLVEEIQSKIENFYRNKSRSILDDDLPFAFKFQYCNRDPIPNLISQNELLLVDVKIKAQVQKMEQYPQKIIKNLQYFRGQKRQNLSSFQKLLANYKLQYFNMFIVYFGDCNFKYFKKDKYEIQTIKLLGKTYKLRIFVFYVSKQALVQTFRVINRINNVQYINDLLIQFYQLRRQKLRRKKLKQIEMIKKQKQGINFYRFQNIIIGALGILFAGVTFGYIYFKKINK